MAKATVITYKTRRRFFQFRKRGPVSKRGSCEAITVYL